MSSGQIVEYLDLPEHVHARLFFCGMPVARLLEDIREVFIVDQLELPRDLRRRPGTTSIVESPNAGNRQRSERVTHWRDGQRTLRRTASSLPSMEKRMRRIVGQP